MSGVLERDVWDLLTRDLRLAEDELERAGLEAAPKTVRGKAHPKYQIFEVVTAVVFSRLRPDYRWQVTARSKDNGIDFVGRSHFLRSEPLGIDASIIIGGQCKKRNNPSNLAQELGGSLIAMAASLHPTFFVAVLSANVSGSRVARAKQLLESQLHRDCHIFDRGMIEGLIADHLEAVTPVLARGLSEIEVETVTRYMRSRRAARPLVVEQTDAPAVGWSGAPIRVTLRIQHGGASAGPYRIRWAPERAAGKLLLIAPLGADSAIGAPVNLGNDPLDPFSDRVDLEFVSYASGRIPLGRAEVTQAGGDAVVVTLADADVRPALRPPFYDPPFRGQLDSITEAIGQTEIGTPQVLAVTGAGGAGKTRLCQEAALEARRRGAAYVCSEQVNSLERPYRLFADLLVELAGPGRPGEDPVTTVLAAVGRLQPDLATRAAAAVEALLRSTGSAPAEEDQVLLSCFVLLAAARAQAQPVVLHLQNLHWCTGDALQLVERFIWQVLQISRSDNVNAVRQPVRLLILLEGRVRERQDATIAGWSTRAFEDLVQRIHCRELRCTPFTASQAADFVGRLFEGAWNTNRRLPAALVPAQEELADAVCRSSGANPFHILEQLRLLRQEGIIALNADTGLFYLARPPLGAWALPVDAFESIRARWTYLREENEALARLVAAASSFEDRLPRSLFNYLWECLAPQATQADLETLEIFRPFGAPQQAGEVALRHENYFHALRDLPVSPEERRLFAQTYLAWFDAVAPTEPELLYLQARVRLSMSSPSAEIGDLLRKAGARARELGQRALAARIEATLLDEVYWSQAPSVFSREDLLDACRREADLAQHLVAAGKRDVADERLTKSLDRLSEFQLQSDFEELGWVRKLQLHGLALRAMLVRAKFNNGQPVQAAAISGRAADELVRWMDAPQDDWEKDLEIEIWNVEGIAAALAGELERACVASSRAAQLARKPMPLDDRSLGIVATHANILCAFDVEEALRLIVECVQRSDAGEATGHFRERLSINLALVQVVRAYRADARQERALLDEAAALLRPIQRDAAVAGRFSTAAAAALLLGLVAVLQGEDGRRWFALGVTGASRARQLETLWRCQINLAHSLDLAGESPLESALAALKLMRTSLLGIPSPCESPRFRLIAAPLAAATGYCLANNHPLGAATLKDFPLLKDMFADPLTGTLTEDRGGHASHEWLRLNGRDYVLY